MRRFAYGLDPLCLVGCAAYILNRWWVKPQVAGRFLHGHFNDLWLIPCALPPLLWLHRRLGWRTHDAPPQWSEIALHLVFWAVLFEGIGPRLMPRVTGDPWDVAAYAVGGVLAGIWWHRRRAMREFSGE